MSLGLAKGDKVAFMLDNGPFTAGLLLGAMYGGFVPVPLNVRAGKTHLVYALDHCDARVVFASAEYFATIGEFLEQVERKILVIRADEDCGPEWIESLSSEQLLPDVKPDDDALLIYTSGSTGLPKGVILGHRNIIAAAENSILAHKLSPQDRSLCVLPLYHINAITVTLVSSLVAGGAVVMPHKFLVRTFWEWIIAYRCTWSALVPGIISQLLDWNNPPTVGGENGLRQIRFMRSSSAPLAPAARRAFEERFGIRLIEAMGSTEAGGSIFSNPLPPEPNKIGTPGRPYGFEARIVGPAGSAVAQGQPGEIVLRGPSIMNRYYKSPEETSAVLSSEGWIRTGDLACVDEDGYFFIVGRARELIIKGGMNISPRQIDEAIEGHPAVLEAAAVGISDHYLGEDIIAFAVLRSNAKVSDRELLERCRQQLGSFKTPSRIHIVNELPKGPSGKVQRLRLLECFKDLVNLSKAPAPTAWGANDSSKVRSAEFGAPRTPVEELLAEIWANAVRTETVGIHDNFFSLGGHSLLAIETVFHLRQEFAIELSLNDFFGNPTVARLAQVVNEQLLRNDPHGTVAKADIIEVTDEPLASRRAVLDDILLQRRNAITDDQTIPPCDRSSPCPLSPGQESIWFLEQLNPGMRAYNEGDACRMKGALDIRLLEQSLNVVIARHETLRTVIRNVDGTPVQVLCEPWSLKIKEIDLTAVAADVCDSEVERLVTQEMRLRYRLTESPGIRATLVRIAPDDHVLILGLHHITCDGWSLGILYRELGEVYRALRRGEPFHLPPAKTQFRDFGAWQRRQLEEGRFVEELDFWREYLAGAPPALELPTKGPRATVFSHNGEKQIHPIGKALREGLQSLSQREEVSVFIVLTAAFNVLLNRYTGQHDIVTGIPFANRDRPELLTVIGFLIDFQALRLDLSGDPSVRELVKQVHKRVLEVNAHRALPFAEVVKALRPNRDLSHAPLFQVMLVWKDRQVQMQFMDLDGLALSHVPTDSKSPKFDLEVLLTDVGDDLWIEYVYCTDLFSAEMIRRMAGHFQNLLSGIVADPDRRIGELPLVTDQERAQVLVEWNATQTDFPRDACVHELFEEQVKRSPGRVAVVYEGQRLTYGELNERAEQLAERLSLLDVAPTAFVGIYMDRSTDMLIALLGTLKAGGAYLPLDPLYPPAYLAMIVEESQPQVILTQTHLRERLPSHSSKVICIDGAAPGVQTRRQSRACPKAASLAYLLYTSGSTGRPKGVQVSHRAVVNLLIAMQHQPGLAQNDILLSVTTLAFDIAALELFLPLIAGASIVLASHEVVTDGTKLAELLTASGANVMQATPSRWKMMIQAGWRGNPKLKILCGGEVLSRELADELLQRCDSLWNVYGPTETTIWSTVHQVRAGEPIVIGRPIANTQIYVLDNHRQPVPVGVLGELYIGGTGVSAGYLNRPELNAERFVPNPFSSEPGERLFRTGDVARHRPDGSLEFLGRLDHQVKLRGFRIELDEIETVLSRHPGVRNQVVTVRQDADGESYLTAYVVPTPGTVLETDTLWTFLKDQLPDYMMPSAYVLMERLPLTPNGKLDRRALPAPTRNPRDAAYRYIAPQTPVQEQLQRIWTEMLNQDRVSINENFFELGGHSLLAVHLLAQIQTTFGVRLTLASVFDHATIEKIAEAIENAPGYTAAAMNNSLWPTRSSMAESSVAGNESGVDEPSAHSQRFGRNGSLAGDGVQVLDSHPPECADTTVGSQLPLNGSRRIKPSDTRLNGTPSMSLYRFLAVSDHWIARTARKIKHNIDNFSLPIPRRLFLPMRFGYTILRSVYHFGLRVFICEPFFKTYCERYGKNLHTGVFLHWIQGKGIIILGNKVTVDGKCTFTFAARFDDRPVFSVGNNTGIGHDCRFVVGKSITIGSYCRIAGGTNIFDSSGHPTDAQRRARGESGDKDDVRPIVICDHVWIGRNATIFPGVTIGEGAIISAGSVVMSDVPPYTVVAGNPAGKVGEARPRTRQAAAPTHVRHPPM